MIRIEVYQPKKHQASEVIRILGITEEILSEYCSHENALYTAFQGEQMIGCIGFNVTSGEILHLRVDPRHRRKGAGRQLIKSIHGRVLSPMLKVRANEESANFFRACGFLCDEDFRYYHVIMGRKCC